MYLHLGKARRNHDWFPSALHECTHTRLDDSKKSHMKVRLDGGSGHWLLLGPPDVQETGTVGGSILHFVWPGCGTADARWRLVPSREVGTILPTYSPDQKKLMPVGLTVYGCVLEVLANWSEQKTRDVCSFLASFIPCL